MEEQRSKKKSQDIKETKQKSKGKCVPIRYQNSL